MRNDMARQFRLKRRQRVFLLAIARAGGQDLARAGADEAVSADLFGGC